MNMPLLEKKITWNGSQWMCDDLTVCVKIETEKGLMPIEIDPKGISLIANPDCLVMGTPQPSLDQKWVVPVMLRDGFGIGPNGIVSIDSMGEGRIPACQIGQPRVEVLPTKRIELQVELTVKFAPPGLGAAMGLAGMVPGGAWTMNQGIPPITLKSGITYQVAPPRVSWAVCGDYQPVRLSGERTPEVVTVSADLLPPGWENSARIEFALSEKSQQLGLSLGANVAYSSSSMDYDISFASEQLCMTPVKELAHNENICNATIELLITIVSEYLGTQSNTVLIDAQALDVSLYFGKQPAALYEWTDKNKVIVIPLGKETGNIPRSCRFPMELRYLANWPVPEITWELDPSVVMTDRLAGTSGEKNEYTAPGIESWESVWKPELRTFWCKVGRGTDTQSIEIKDHPGLYTYLPLDVDLHLTDQLRKVRLKVRVGPADLLVNNQSLDLTNPDVMKSLVRETEIEVEYL